MHLFEHLKTLERGLFQASAYERAIDSVRIIVFRNFGLDGGMLHDAKARMEQHGCLLSFGADFVRAALYPGLLRSGRQVAVG